MTKREWESGRVGEWESGKSLRWWLVMVCLVCSAQVVWAQSGRKPGQPQPGQQPGEKPILRLETKEVIVPLSAYDAEGNLIGDLEAKDVLVLEDGEARPVSFIRHEPANVVLIIDSSNEIGTFKNGETQRKPKEQVESWKNQGYQILPRPTARSSTCGSAAISASSEVSPAAATRCRCVRGSTLLVARASESRLSSTP